MSHFIVKLWEAIRRFIVECDGSAATEYSILLALVVLAVLGVVTALGTSSTGLFHSAANETANSTGGTDSGPASNAFGAVVNSANP